MSFVVEQIKNNRCNILFNNNKFRETYSLKIGEIIWRCLGQSCGATIRTDNEKKSIILTNDKHSGPHPVTMRSLGSFTASPSPCRSPATTISPVPVTPHSAATSHAAVTPHDADTTYATVISHAEVTPHATDNLHATVTLHATATPHATVTSHVNVIPHAAATSHATVTTHAVVTPHAAVNSHAVALLSPIIQSSPSSMSWPSSPTTLTHWRCITEPFRDGRSGLKNAITEPFRDDNNAF